MPVRGAGAVRFKFRNPLNAFLHAKGISCILFCPEKQQQKNQPREGLQFAYFEIPSHEIYGCKGDLKEAWWLEGVFLEMFCLLSEVLRFGNSWSSYYLKIWAP